MNALSALPSAPAVHGSPLAVLIEPSDPICSSVVGVLAAQGYAVRITNGVTDDLDQATLAIVEADRASRTVGLIRQIHAQRPELPVVGVLPWWTDDEVDLLGAARYVLHVPVREDQLRGLAELAADVLSAPVA